MLDGYHQVFQEFAGNSAFRDLDIPDPNLAVDFGEVLRSVGIRTNYQMVHKPRIVQPDTRDIDKAMIDGISEKLTTKDFPNTGWLGDYGGTL